MLPRVVACAALIFAWPFCAQIEGSTLAFHWVAAAVAQEATQEQAIAALDQNSDTEAKTQLAAGQAGFSAAPAASTELAPPIQPASSQTALAAAAAPFGLVAERVSEGKIVNQWRRVEGEIREDKRVLARCRKDASSCPSSAQRFLAIVDEGRARGGRARIGVINRAINLAIMPTSDLIQWGVADRWSAPLETFTTRRGDCEDYAIAKYVALRAAGVPAEDVKLVVVRDSDMSENHAVVAARLDDGWVIMDNRWLALVPDWKMWRETPLFEIDDNGVSRFVAPTVNARLANGTLASF